MMGKFLLFFLLIFGVCEALQHTTQNAKLAESLKDSSDFVESNSDFTANIRQDSTRLSTFTESHFFAKRAAPPPRSPTRQTAAAVSLLGESLAFSRFLHKKSGGTTASFAPLFMHHEAERDAVRTSCGLNLIDSHLAMTNEDINSNDSAESIKTIESLKDSNIIDCHDSATQNLAMTTMDDYTQSTTFSDDKDEIPRKSLELHDDKQRADSSDKAFDYEFPRYNDESFLNSLITRFSLYNETYFMPVYYQTHIVKSPYNKPYKKLETKLQISAKMNIFRDLFWGIGAFFGYTQTSFFQIYSQHISSPFRSNDYSPEFMLYKPLNVEFWGGSLYNIRFGYRHKSNGEVNIKNGGNANFSRGIDTIALDIAYKISDFRLILKLWAYAKKSPKDIDKYLGYSDLILEYDFLSRNHLRLTIGNLAHNYAKYKGSVKLEYSFDIHNFALYLQYFYGYGDNMIEYNIKKHGVGIGFSVMKF